MNLRTSLIYGSISGSLIISSFFIVFFIQGDNPDYSIGELVGYASMLLAFTAVFIGMKNFRDKSLGGIMTFKQGFLTGLGIVLVASSIYVIGWMIYQPNFAPDFADKYNAAEIAKVQVDTDLSEEEKKEQIHEMEEFLVSYKKPYVMAAYTFLEIFPVGLVVALIAALFLKKKS